MDYEAARAIMLEELDKVRDKKDSDYLRELIADTDTGIFILARKGKDSYYVLYSLSFIKDKKKFKKDFKEDFERKGFKVKLNSFSGSDFLDGKISWD